MYVFEPMMPEDILSLDIANLDDKSENFTFEYYLGYLLDHGADFFTVRSFGGAQSLQNTCMIYSNPVLGYIFGMREFKDRMCFHLSALSIGPPLRMLGLGSYLMRLFEENGNIYRAWFTDLYVRMSNTRAVSFYRKNGFVVHRRVLEYYCAPEEDALDMRKSLRADSKKECEVPGKNLHAFLL